MSDEKPRAVFGRPQYATLEEFKEFITKMTRALKPDAQSTLTDEQWEQYYKKFLENLNSTEADDKTDEQ